MNMKKWYNIRKVLFEIPVRLKIIPQYGIWL